jgi:hypothetical protein
MTYEQFKEWFQGYIDRHKSKAYEDALLLDDIEDPKKDPSLAARYFDKQVVLDECPKIYESGGLELIELDDFVRECWLHCADMWHEWERFILNGIDVEEWIKAGKKISEALLNEV